MGNRVKCDHSKVKPQPYTTVPLYKSSWASVRFSCGAVVALIQHMASVIRASLATLATLLVAALFVFTSDSTNTHPTMVENPTTDLVSESEFWLVAKALDMALSQVSLWKSRHTLRKHMPYSASYPSTPSFQPYESRPPTLCSLSVCFL